MATHYSKNDTPIKFSVHCAKQAVNREKKRMAERSPPKQKEQDMAFKEVQLFKNETLGTGSYGAVCKAKCDQLICAAKLLYPVLFQIQTPDPGKEHRQPFHRFEQECEFLSRVNHPNIVQYLGTYRDPETNAPVLLMELMDESLTHFLESSPEDIPYHIQVNLSQDIAQALAFLHAKGIIHRDLSSNNVLLIAGSRAKVSDFGMSKFADISKTRLATMTQCPGTPAFMSPEALNEPPVYTEKLDTFSLGVLLVQIMTRKFPDPTDRFKMMRFPNPQNSSQTIEALVAIPETERRQAHISLIEPTHPLLPIVPLCLKDKEAERPSIQQLCQSLDALKTGEKYQRSTAQNTIHFFQTKVSQLQNQLQDTSKELEDKDTQIKQLKEKLEQPRGENQQDIQNREEVVRLNEQLRYKEEQISTLQEIIAQRDKKMPDLKEATVSKDTNPSPTDRSLAQQANATTITSGSNSTLTTTILNSPFKLDRGSVTEKGDIVYFKSRNSSLLLYDLTKNLWRELPTHPPIEDYTITMVSYTTLTTVGGMYRSLLGNEKYSNQLYSYDSGKWEKCFSSMSKRRAQPAVVSTSKELVVAGGLNETGPVNTVEVMNISVKVWSTASSLPFPASQPTVALYGENIYVHSRNSIAKSSFRDLINSQQNSDKWNVICSLPVTSSTLVNVYGRLLAVGGRTSKDNTKSKEILEYDQVTDSWQVVGEMTKARNNCLAALLPNKKLLVAGGSGDTNGLTMEVITFPSKKT